MTLVKINNVTSRKRQKTNGHYFDGLPPALNSDLPQITANSLFAVLSGLLFAVICGISNPIGIYLTTFVTLLS
jgi:hypothetical protein